MYPYDKDTLSRDLQLWIGGVGRPHGIKEYMFSNKVRGETGPKEYNLKVEWLSENDFFIFSEKE